jgi:flavin-dependent dehydrogenase
MDDIQCDSDTTEMYFGHQFAPGGYAWIIPKEESIANVGLGIRRSFASEQIPLRDYLTRFIRTHPLVSPRMKYAKVLQSVSAIIPVGGSHSITCSDNVILAGDAAGHIMASNGGGIPTALAGGLLAGKTAVKNILEGTSLFMYQDIWKKEFGAELESALSVLRIADQVMTSDSVTDCCMRLAGARYIKHLIRCRLPFPVELASKTIVRMLHWFDNEVNI